MGKVIRHPLTMTSDSAVCVSGPVAGGGETCRPGLTHTRLHLHPDAQPNHICLAMTGKYLVTQNISPAFLLAATQATPRPADGLRSVSSEQRRAQPSPAQPSPAQPSQPSPAQPSPLTTIMFYFQPSFMVAFTILVSKRWRRCSEDLDRRGLATPEKVDYMVGVEVA